MPPDFLEDLGHGVFAIDTGFIRPRYDAAYLILSDEGRAAFVDTGTNHALPRHLQALEALGIGRDAVDWVIPTHVHLDHAGGAGALMAALPRARLAIHPRGERHMIDPSALFEGAAAVYGEATALRDYGRLVPVSVERVRVVHEGDEIVFGSRALRVLDTPGHARHHHCYWDETTRGWFTGDTFGISIREFDVPGRGAFVTPSIVPTQFEPVPLRASIGRLIDAAPDGIYVTHYGRVAPPAELAAQCLARLERMVALGQAHRAPTPDRAKHLDTGLRELFAGWLGEHGIAPDAHVMELVSVDIELAVAGLQIWLDREAKAPRSA